MYSNTQERRTFDIKKLTRASVQKLRPYSSARDEFKGRAEIYLDANENAYGSVVGENLNRYPDPMQWKLKEKISEWKSVDKNSIFLGNGSDEGIDLVFRAFCEPQEDNVIIMPPTYGMYQVSADINNVETFKVPLNRDFSIPVKAVLAASNIYTKAIFVCSPNNPTGNQIANQQIEELLQNFRGLVVVDEAYIDFSEQESVLPLLEKYSNLMITQTFSKAWGLAALRLGVTFASAEIITVLNKIKPPYNINAMTSRLALEAMSKKQEVDAWVTEIIAERKRLEVELQRLDFVEKIHPSDANFLLIKVVDPHSVYNYLLQQGIVVRDRSSQMHCEGSVRITVGTAQENTSLLAALKTYERIFCEF